MHETFIRNINGDSQETPVKLSFATNGSLKYHRCSLDFTKHSIQVLIRYEELVDLPYRICSYRAFYSIYNYDRLRTVYRVSRMSKCVCSIFVNAFRSLLAFSSKKRAEMEISRFWYSFVFIKTTIRDFAKHLAIRNFATISSVRRKNSRVTNGITPNFTVFLNHCGTRADFWASQA